ncbi:MAG: hypothetical protein AAGE65_15160, partial [Planctomycetota bacterium]
MFGGKVRRAGTIDELLTKHDETTITAPALDEEREQRLIAAMEQAGVADVAVRRGRQRLESLFLDIVEEAQRTGLATAGAGNAGRVASFLTEANTLEGMEREDDDASQGDAVIESLVVDTPAAAQASEHADSQADSEPTPAAADANNVLAALTGTAPETPGEEAPPAPASPSAAKAEDQKDADRSVIDDLLN